MAEDLTKLDVIDEDSISRELSTRLASGKRYTRAGELLISVHDEVAEQRVSPMESFGSPEATISNSPGSAYAVAQDICHKLRRKSQSVVLHGNSGTCKSLVAEQLIGYICHVTHAQEGEVALGERLSSALAILRHFGCASTGASSSTPRFGSWTKLYFDENCGERVLRGACITPVLFEHTRVTTKLPEGARNFHVFYQLSCCASALPSSWMIRPASEFSLLRQGGSVNVESIDDVAEFGKLRRALTTCSFDESLQLSVFRVLAGILHLGELRFVSKDRSVRITTSESLQVAAELLSVDPDELGNLLCSHSSFASQAKGARDSACQSLYSSLVNFVVTQINKSIGSDKKSSRFFGILDLAGFEQIEENNFEQLMINYANERLQSLFIKEQLETEEAIHRAENLPWVPVEYSTNDQVVHVIQESVDLLANSESDTVFLSKMAKVSSVPLLVDLEAETFTLAHSSSSVTYSVKGFKQRCARVVLAPLFSTNDDLGITSSLRETKSVDRQLLQDLQEIESEMTGSHSWFVWCVAKDSMPRQLCAQGIVAAVRVKKAALPVRFEFTEFYSRFRKVGNLAQLPQNVAASQAANALAKKLADAQGVSQSDWKMGATKIFLSSSFAETLERLRDSRIARQELRRLEEAGLKEKSEQQENERFEKEKQKDLKRRQKAKMASDPSLPFDKKKDCLKLLVSLKEWIKFDSTTDSTIVDSSQKQIAQTTTRLFANTTDPVVGNTLVEAITSILLTGRSVIADPSKLDADPQLLAKELKVVIDAVKMYLVVRETETLVEVRKSTGPEQYFPLDEIPRRFPIERLTNLVEYFDNRTRRQSTSEQRETASTDITYSVVERMSDAGTGLPLESVRVGIKTYNRCFTAKSVVEWLVKNSDATNALQASKIFGALAADGIFVQAYQDIEKLSNCLYKWCDDDSASTVAAPEASFKQQMSAMVGFKNFDRNAPPGLNEAFLDWKHATNEVRDGEWAPRTCPQCAAVCPLNGKKRCGECKATLFCNSNGKPLRLMITLSAGYNYELGCNLVSSTPDWNNALRLEQAHTDYPHYQRTLAALPHVNYLGYKNSKVPSVVVAVQVARDEVTALEAARVYILSANGFEREVISLTELKETRLRAKLLNNLPQLAGLKLAQLKDASFVATLADFEQKMIPRTYKFGVLLVRKGQVTEDAIYCNQHSDGSVHYREFLSILGDTVDLSKHTGYRGGLDTRGSNSTGINSIFRTECFTSEGLLIPDGGKSSNVATETIEVMYHVGTLLPFSVENTQQLHKKRHIGNDIVVVLFREDDAKKTAIDPTLFKSNFNHVFVVVTPCKFKVHADKTKTISHFHVQIACKSGVKPFRPYLPNPSVFANNELFKQMLFCKLVNAEKAAMYSKDFSAKMRRTFIDTIKTFQEKV